MGDDGYGIREETAMYRREQESEVVTRPPERARRRADEATQVGLAARAAVAGRTDALGHASVLHLQRAVGNAGVAQLLESDEPSPVHEVIGRGGGSPLDGPVRQRMERSFGQDFSDVRVHADGGAARSAHAVDAHAYTVGNEIVLGDGHAPGSGAFEQTLAHELTHVVQQRNGPVDGTPAGGGIAVSDPGDRFERAADATAQQVMSTGRAGSASGGGAAGVQREAMPEGEVPTQGLWIQRERGDEEEPAPASSTPTDLPRPDASSEPAPAGASSENTERPGSAGGSPENTDRPGSAEVPSTAQSGPSETASSEVPEEEQTAQGLWIQRLAEDEVPGQEEEDKTA